MGYDENVMHIRALGTLFWFFFKKAKEYECRIRIIQHEVVDQIEDLHKNGKSVTKLLQKKIAKHSKVETKAVSGFVLRRDGLRGARTVRTSCLETVVP